eukprot:CAMPEP_0201506920 /NCGR_PEP_ID=MMETSP0161_2-20130828/747_1 /ASSEMBLY_ACC=CAM_ASM_000251 /TAXON_ID=180227 /ORGANISM="Neoparamoeba aestuarina, Strain SoJaBio B1-5/56/2" /LENGTH=130 /DNA_ID=CAMNT_0047901159 /DNA_START=121 /DNA_END=513 /DNA_ORIENTATION=-
MAQVDALTNDDVAELLDENLPEDPEELKKYVFKRVLEKEAIERKNALNAMSAEDREAFLETEGMPQQLQIFHNKARDVHNDVMGLPAAEFQKHTQDWNFSRGWRSIDVAMPSPPPEHTFEELPIIKETTN